MARWSDLAEWRGPTVNEGPNMAEQRGLVVHVAEGFYGGTIGWQKNPDANVSSHFIVAGAHDVPKGTPDGKLAQMVDTVTAAWTQRAGNGHWLSIECSGFTPDPLSPAQVESIAQIYARGVRDLGWPLQLAGDPSGRGLGYHSMGTPANGWTGSSWGHEDCPGPAIIDQLPAVLARASQIVNGNGDTEGEDEDVKRLIVFRFTDGFGHPYWSSWEGSGIRTRLETDADVRFVLDDSGSGSVAFPGVKTASDGVDYPWPDLADDEDWNPGLAQPPYEARINARLGVPAPARERLPITAGTFTIAPGTRTAGTFAIAPADPVTTVTVTGPASLDPDQ